MFAATPVTNTLSQWFDQNPNPYLQRGSVFDNYHPDALNGSAAAVPPSELRLMTDSTTHPLAFLVSDSNSQPLLLVMPFTGGLAGDPRQMKYFLTGDVTAVGAHLPSIVPMPDGFFNQALPNTVFHAPTVAEMANVWAGQAGADVLEPYATIEDGVEVIAAVRKSVPVPHELVSVMLRAQDARPLTWRSIWTDFVVPHILVDPSKVIDYETFTRFLRASSTKRNPVNGDERPPPTSLPVAFDRTPPSIRNQAAQRLKCFLPGIGAPVGVGAQVQQMHQQLLQNQATNATTTANAKTIEYQNAPMFESLSRLHGTRDEALWGPYWGQYSSGNRKSHEYLGLLDSTNTSVARGLSVTAPVISPNLALDVSTGQWVSMDLNDVTTGFSIFRIGTVYSDRHSQSIHRNRVYNILSHGAGASTMDAVQLILTNNEVDPPTDATSFRTYLEGFYVLLVSTFGSICPLVQAYKNYLFSRLNNIIPMLERMYRNHADSTKELVYLKVMVYVWRITNRYIGDALAAPFGAVIAAPTYERVEADLHDGRLYFITELPLGLVKASAPVPPTPRQPRGGGGPPTTPAGGRGTGEETGRSRVDRPSQNVNLKSAWSALNHQGVFSAGSPFRDESLPHGKKVVASDRPDTRRICLSIALTGSCYSNCRGKHEPLTQSEVQRVAQAGNLTVGA